ncbi:MAG: hypothetical protein AB8H47_15600 [Bacteroidia bacterium]
MENLLIAEIATDSCYKSLPQAENSYPILENCNYIDGRDFIATALLLTDYSLGEVDLAFESSRKAYRVAKKARCQSSKEKSAIAIEQLRLARQEIQEARDQIILIERQWLLINEGRNEVSGINSAEYQWANGPKNYIINTARLAILNTYNYLEIAKLAIEEAQLVLCG